MKEATKLQKVIDQAQKDITKLNEEKFPLSQKIRTAEAEVGPIKYIAELIYGDQAKDEGFLEKAVRIVIMMIVSVFDPLAVLMLIAANWSLKNTVRKDWNSFFNKEPVPMSDFPPVVTETKDILVQDDITIGDKPDAWIADVGGKPTKEELQEIEDDLEIKVDEPASEWSPEMYRRVQPTPENSKTKSFLNRVSQSLGVKTIEKEVEDLQNKNPK